MEKPKITVTLSNLISNTAWLFADKILQMGLGLVVGIWVARYLGPEQYGMLNYAISFVALFGPIAGWGLDAISVRELASEPEKKEEILGTTFVLKLLGGFLILFLTFVAIYLLKPDEILTRWLVGIIAVGTIFQSFETIDFWFRSQTQSKYTVLAKNFTYVLATVIKIILIQTSAPLIAFAAIKSGEIGFTAIGLVVVYGRRGGNIFRWQPNFKMAHLLLQDSWPLIISGISTYIYATIDQVMLGQMSTVKSLGIYSVAVKLSEIFNFLPVVISQSVLPTVVNKYKEGEQSLLHTMQNIYDIMAILWFFIAVFISSFSPWIVSKVYGEAYSESAIILSVYVWSQFGSNFGVARSLYINVKNLFKLSLIISFAGAFLNIALNSWLIPQYEAMGATVATLITYFVAVVGINIVFPELRKLLPIIGKSLIIPNSIFRLIKEYRKSKNKSS
ncbi:flippase [Oxynema aestuarii]|uniref:Flippase n=1 Tax=Oxynema aestuarii AP17 TaxID=2064643 RepID=A0A6H1TY66_9CYAN|nr:flippase [Oxynema aestuarii]QIZ71558.1 flippase [Oxynema aestuarii AP17]